MKVQVNIIVCEFRSWLPLDLMLNRLSRCCRNSASTGMVVSLF